MADDIAKVIADTRTDAATLQEVVNGDENTQITSRLGESYPSVQKAIKLMTQAGVGFSPFELKTEMTSSELVDGNYAIVTNDTTENNGLYKKKSGAWSKVSYDVDERQKNYADVAANSALTDSKTYADGVGAAALSQSKTYTDTAKTSAISTAATDATEKADAALVSAKTYADNKDAVTLNAAKLDATTKATDAKTAAILDAKTNLIETQLDVVASNARLVSDDKGDLVPFAFTDYFDKVIAYIDEHGNINASNISNVSGSFLSWGLVDKSGFLGFGVDNKGNIINQQFNDLQVTVDGIINPPEPPLRTLKNQQTDFMHIMTYGQSLSRGAQGLPIISTTQPYQNITFNSGVLKHSYSPTADFSTFKPLIEEELGNYGETPTSAMCNRLVELNDSSYRFVGSSAGQGDRSIQQLNKGTIYYNELLQQVESARDLAAVRNKSYSVYSVTWTQGENNYSSTVNSSQSDYYELLKELHEDLVEDITAITNQKFRPPFVGYQTAAHRKYNSDTMQIALAQLQYADDTADYIVATPVYMLDHATDQLHMTADSYVALGKYYAKALHHSLNNDEKWQPLRPKYINAYNRIIDIEFNKTGLVIDTTQVAETHNYGFDIRDANDELVDIIELVEIATPNRIRIKLSNPLPLGSKLTYARGRIGDPAQSGNQNGARGNVRDSAGDVDNYLDSTGATFKLHNWCAHFEQYL